MSTAPDGEATTRHGVAPGACALSRLDRIRIGIVVVLLGMTIAWFNLFPRYQQSGEDLQHNGRFERGLEDWSVRGPAGAVSVDAGSARLELANPEWTAQLSQVLVLGPEQRTLGMTVEASSEGVVPGDLSWQSARVYLIGRNSAGKPLWISHLQAAVLSGDSPWKQYSGTLNLPRRATDAVIVAELSRATGVLRVRNVRVFPLREAAGFRIGVYALLAAWAIAGLFVVPIIVRGLRSTAARALTGIAALAILGGVLIPYSLKRDIFRPLENEMRVGQSLLPALPPEVDRLLGLAIDHMDTIAHGVFFFAAAMILRVFQREDRAGVQFGLLLLFAGVTETLQYFTASRSPGVYDWLWDAGGITLAFLLSWCFGVGRKPRVA